jgi:hypothetical protein
MFIYVKVYAINVIIYQYKLLSGCNMASYGIFSYLI